MWTSVVDGAARSMVGLGAFLGGSAASGIFALTFAVRVLAIPVMLPLAVRARARSRIMAEMKPRLRELNAELKSDPSAHSRAVSELHREHGIAVVDWPALAGALVQLPILIALFQASLNVSAAHGLDSGGAVTGVAAAALALFGARTGGQAEGAPWILWVSAVVPIAMALWLGLGIALYLAAFYAGAAVQSLLMRREASRPTVPGPA